MGEHRGRLNGSCNLARPLNRRPSNRSSGSTSGSLRLSKGPADGVESALKYGTPDSPEPPTGPDCILPHTSSGRIDRMDPQYTQFALFGILFAVMWRLDRKNSSAHDASGQRIDRLETRMVARLDKIDAKLG